MKKNNQDIEQYRVTKGRMASNRTYGNNGLFIIHRPKNRSLQIIVSDGEGWEHVSVTPFNAKGRCPTWDDMCFTKDLFWGKAETVIQYHPPKSEYIDNHPYCLHLWRPIDQEIPRPPAIFVGLPTRKDKLK